MHLVRDHAGQFGMPEEELLGALPTLDYDNTAPFPIGEIKATAEVVKDGKIVQVGDDWMPVPKLEKW